MFEKCCAGASLVSRMRIPAGRLNRSDVTNISFQQEAGTGVASSLFGAAVVWNRLDGSDHTYNQR